MGIFFILCNIDERYEVIYLCLLDKDLYHVYKDDGFIYCKRIYRLYASAMSTGPIMSSVLQHLRAHIAENKTRNVNEN